MLAIKNLFNRFSYSLVWCNLINCIGIQDKVLGSPVRLEVEEIQQHIEWIQRETYPAFSLGVYMRTFLCMKPTIIGHFRAWKPAFFMP